MTVQHSGGLHAAWLLNVCVCACVCLRVCVCEDFLKSSHVGNISWCLRYKEWCVCPSVRFVSWCLLFFNFCATGPDCMTRTATGTATLLHIWLRVHVGWPATASESQISYSQSTSAVWERERETLKQKGGERERESWSVHLSLHPSVCLSLWTALSPSSQIRLLIVWAFLDRFASNSRSCTGNVDETNKSQKEGLMRNVIFLVFGGVEEPSDDHSDMKRWLQAGETLENKTINQNVRRKIIVFEQ